MKTLKFQDSRTQKLGEQQIIRRILGGEKELYELLMRRNNQKLYRVIAGYLESPQEIADVMQDTYLKAYEKLFQFKFRARFSTWLIRIGINEALIRLRQKGKYIELAKREGDSQKKALQMIAEDDLDPENRIIQQEAKQLLELAISKLKPKYRIVYIMKEVEGMSIAEIEDCLDITRTNVKVRHHRARKMLKESLYNLAPSTSTFEFGFSKCDALVEKVLSQI